MLCHQFISSRVVRLFVHPIARLKADNRNLRRCDERVRQPVPRSPRGDAVCRAAVAPAIESPTRRAPTLNHRPGRRPARARPVRWLRRSWSPGARSPIMTYCHGTSRDDWLAEDSTSCLGFTLSAWPDCMPSMSESTARAARRRGGGLRSALLVRLWDAGRCLAILSPAPAIAPDRSGRSSSIAVAISIYDLAEIALPCSGAFPSGHWRRPRVVRRSNWPSRTPARLDCRCAAARWVVDGAGAAALAFAWLAWL